MTESVSMNVTLKIKKKDIYKEIRSHLILI